MWESGDWKCRYPLQPGGSQEWPGVTVRGSFYLGRLVRRQILKAISSLTDAQTPSPVEQIHNSSQYPQRRPVRLDSGWDHLEGKEIQAACCRFLAPNRKPDPPPLYCFQLLHGGFASLTKEKNKQHIASSLIQQRITKCVYVTPNLSRRTFKCIECRDELTQRQWEDKNWCFICASSCRMSVSCLTLEL